MASNHPLRWARLRPELTGKPLGIPAHWTPVLDRNPEAMKPDPMPGFVWLDVPGKLLHVDERLLEFASDPEARPNVTNPFGHTQQTQGEPTADWIKFATVGLVVTELISLMLGISVGEGAAEMDLAAPAGAALQFVFWMGIGALFHSFEANKDEQRLYLFGGMAAASVPVTLITLIAIGGTAAFVASILAAAICLFLGYHQNRD